MNRNTTASILRAPIVAAVCLALSATGATAACVSKSAVATAESAESAKWYVLETMVQSVSWSLWPAFVATGNVPGYTVKNKRYKCEPSGLTVTCNGEATFCEN